MILGPGSEKPGVGAPDDYQRDHPDERPDQWGWHGKWGRSAGVAGLVVAAILLLMTTSTNYQLEYTITLIVAATILVLVVVAGRLRNRHRWRR